MIGSKKPPWVVFISLLLLGVLMYLLWWRWQVSAIRFFDADEFSYMHWTAQVARGERPYVDFLSYFTPGFMWAFAPIFWIVGRSAAVFTVARTVSFIIFLSILGSLGYLFGITRGWRWALVPVVILAFLPMPYDKFLEIRPDNLATLLAIVGVIGEIRAIQSHKNVWWLWSGLAYSASLFVLAKTLPIVVVGAGIAGLYTIFAGPAARLSHPTSSLDLPSDFSHFIGRTLTALHIPKIWVAASLRAVDGSPTSRVTRLLFFFIGLLGPWVLFFLGAAVTGHFGTVWYSLTRLPFEVYQSAANISMEADLFFFPNVSFYGIGSGITMGLIVNHVIWILAIIVGAYRLVTPVLTAEGEKEWIFTELLVALTFFILVYGYVKYFPAKHSQYLIPIVIFVAYYGADGLSHFFDWIREIGGYKSLAIVLTGFAYLLVVVTQAVNAPKLLVTNVEQLTELSTLIKTIPLNAQVVDLEGRMVFWPEGYPVSSLSIDSTLSFVTRPPVTLAVYLTAHPADYIWDGDSGRIGMLLPENIAYIHDHFAPMPGFGDRLWKIKQ